MHERKLDIGGFAVHYEIRLPQRGRQESAERKGERVGMWVLEPAAINTPYIHL